MEESTEADTNLRESCTSGWNYRDAEGPTHYGPFRVVNTRCGDIEVDANYTISVESCQSQLFVAGLSQSVISKEL